MLLILRSRAAFSLLSGSFGSLRFFSLGTSPTRGWRWPTGAGITPPPPPPPEFFGTDDDPCANASGPPIRTTSAIDKIVFRILVLPFVFLPAALSSYRDGTSIVAQLRRPWAAQSCTFRTSAMVPSNQIPSATSTAKKPSITAFSMVRLPSSGGSGAFFPPSVILQSADKGEPRRNNRRYDSLFRWVFHVPGTGPATN